MKVAERILRILKLIKKIIFSNAFEPALELLFFISSQNNVSKFENITVDMNY